MPEVEAIRTANETKLRRFTAFVGIFAMLLILAIALILVNINASTAGVAEFSPEVALNDTQEKVSVNETLIASKLPLQQVENHTELNASFAPVTESLLSWNAEPNPFLAAIRDFLFQARDGLLEVSSTVSEPSVHQDTEEMFKVFEQRLIEATTMLLKVTDDADLFTTTPPPTAESEENIRVVEIESDSLQERGVGMSVLGISNKRQTAMNLMANATTGCSNCYEKLNACVQKCFSDNNCHDVQRQVRSCPPAPTRLCNPFAQWSPVDECQNHEDCRSPNLCCNDGCVNKCSPGVWRLP